MTAANPAGGLSCAFERCSLLRCGPRDLH